MIYGEKRYVALYSCHEENEKKRCPICSSLDTKKNGYIQSRILSNRGYVKRKTKRFLCKSCKHSFTDQPTGTRKRVTDSLKTEAVLDYVTSKASLSEVAKRLSISKMSILNWLESVAEKTPELEVPKEIPWSGYIQIDGKETKLRGRKRVIFIATDSKINRPFNYMLCDGETSENSSLFLYDIKRIYPVQILGVTSDFGRGKCFIEEVNRIFPEALHQICLVHFERYVWLFLPRTKRSRYYWRNQVLKDMIRRIIKAPTSEESLEWLKVLLTRKSFFKASYHKRFLRSVERNYELLTAHYQDKELVTNSNLVENINRQLERKLKNTDGFKVEENLASFLRIWFHYRVENMKFSHS